MAMGEYNWNPNPDAKMSDCQDSVADVSDGQDSETDDQDGFADMAENDITHYDIGELVWAKVRSHPWWPGQVFDPTLASEEAKSTEKPGRLLVAFYGDHTFSWLEYSHILPFRSNFQVKMRATHAKLFKQAVSEALDEVFWRAQFGLQCRCHKRFLGYECTASSKDWSHGSPVRFRLCKGVPLSKEVLNAQQCLRFIKDMACSACRRFSFGYASTVLHGNALGIRTGLFANLGENVVLGSESDFSPIRASIYMSASSLDASDRDAINGTTMNGQSWSECRKRLIEESAFPLEEWRAKRSHLVERDDKASDFLMQISQALHFLAIDPLCSYGSDSTLASAVDAVLSYRNLVFQKGSGYSTRVRSFVPEDGKRILAHCVSEHDRLYETKAIRYCRPTNQRCNGYGAVHAKDPNFAETPQNQTKQMATPDWTTGAAHEGKKVFDKECGRMDVLPGLSPMKGVSRAFDTERNLVDPKLDVHELLLEAQRVKKLCATSLKREGGDFSQERKGFDLEIHACTRRDMKPHDETKACEVGLNEVPVRESLKSSASKRKSTFDAIDCLEPACVANEGFGSDNGVGFVSAMEFSENTREDIGIRSDKRSVTTGPSIDDNPIIESRPQNIDSYRSSENGTMSHPPIGLFMKFPLSFALPSEFQLNAIFKEFGALGSAGARVFRETASAQVIFKHASEAERAYKCVKQVNPFGNASVAFRLQHFARS